MRWIFDLGQNWVLKFFLCNFSVIFQGKLDAAKYGKMMNFHRESIFCILLSFSGFLTMFWPRKTLRLLYKTNFEKTPTLKVESFAGIKFRGDKLSRTSRAKIKFRGYKLSRMEEILSLFSYFGAIFCCFLIDISRMNSEVRFRGY